MLEGLHRELGEGTFGGDRLVLEATEGGVDEKLLHVSRLVEHIEQSFHGKDRLVFGVRNVDYAEPIAGYDYPHEVFQPVPSLRIRPWSPNLKMEQEDRVLVIDSVHAFGNGRHPTTRMCLACLEGLGGAWLGGKSVLDFGCGTGLLAIGAVSMGAAHALGVERDAEAVRSAARNVALNRLDRRIEIRTGSWEQVERSFDLVLANLVPAALLRAGEQIHRHLSDRGRAVLSGFGRERTEETEAFFSGTGLRTVKRLDLEGWGALIMEQNRGVDM
jgi:ribosomal protein L11 methylase PrmA